MKLTNSFMVSSRIISNRTSNPEMVHETMKRTMAETMKLLHERYVFDLFTRLCKKKIGTNAMENHCRRICDGLSRGRQRSMLERVMKWRLQNARSNMYGARKENTRVWRESKRILRTFGVIGTYVALWRREKEHYQVQLREKLRLKVDTLVRRYSSEEVAPENVRGIVVGDRQIPDSFSTEPRCYGGVQLSADEQALLSLPLKYAVFSKIDTTDCKAQVEKGFAKMRWSIQKREREEQNGEEEQDERNSFKPATNVFDFRMMRATDLPFNQRVKLPDPVNDDMEIKMHSLKRELERITEAVQSNVKNFSNLSKEQYRGLKSLTNRTRTNDVVVFQTDKSGRFLTDTPGNYRSSVQPHVGEDPEITPAAHGTIEKLLNAHGIAWTRLLAAGMFTHNDVRIKNNMIYSNSEAPPLYGLRKDHKVHPDSVIGPPTRPVCGANASANYRLSHLLSIILSEVWKRDRSGCVCMNTEELLAEIERVNSEGLGSKTIIGSTDVKALYPSLDITFTIQKVCEVFKTSNVTIVGIDYEELGLYISLNRTAEEIREVGLEAVCPTREGRRGARPKITSSGSATQKEDRFRPWQPALSAPSRQKQRSMLVEALIIGLGVVMNNHTYRLDGRILHQPKSDSRGNSRSRA